MDVQSMRGSSTMSNHFIVKTSNYIISGMAKKGFEEKRKKIVYEQIANTGKRITQTKMLKVHVRKIKDYSQLNNKKQNKYLKGKKNTGKL